MGIACSATFHFLQAATLQKVLTCKFTMNQFTMNVAFIAKDFKRHYKVEQLKIGQVLQIGICITKQDNFYLKVGQYLQSNGVQKGN